MRRTLALARLIWADFIDRGRDPRVSRPPTSPSVQAERAIGQSPPRRARPQYPEDAVQDPPVVHSRHAARLVRQQRRDHDSLEIAQLVSCMINAPSWGA
jgi:hypothetical protein